MRGKWSCAACEVFYLVGATVDVVICIVNNEQRLDEVLV